MTRREILRAMSAATPLGLLQPGLAAAEQQSSPGQKLKVVVVGGHPDDPETGAGGTMARFSALGHDVVSMYLTRGEAGVRGTGNEEAARIRTAEARQACKILGARAVFVGQVDGATEVNPRWYIKFRELLLGENPSLVLVHWPIDTHPDHRTAYMLTYEAWQNAKTKFGLYFFEVMTGSQSQNFTPTDYVDITTTEAKKREACYAHKSQEPDGFYQRHDEMNRFRGRECNVPFAEAFVRYVGDSGKELGVVGA